MAIELDQERPKLKKKTIISHKVDLVNKTLTVSWGILILKEL